MTSFETTNNNLCYLFNKKPDLVNGTNEDLIEAYREEFEFNCPKGFRTASESITRAWRKLKEQGLYKPTDLNMIAIRKQRERQFHEYYA
jgi:hypothetical protein